MGKALTIGEWAVDPTVCTASRDGETVRLRPKVMDLLVLLAEHPGVVLSKDQVLNGVWGTEAVSESALTRTMTELRQALGDDAGHPVYIETIPKRGYRLTARVTQPDQSEGPITPAASVAERSLASVQPSLPQQFSAAVEPAPLPASHVRGHASATREASTDPTIARVGRRRFVAAMAAIVVALGVGATGVVGWRSYRHPVIPFHARDWVLVTDVENKTGNPVLDGTIAWLLERELSNSQYVNVASRDTIDETLRLMRRPPDTRIDLSIGRELALRDGSIKGLVTGRIEKLGGKYVLTTAVVNPSDGALAGGFSDEAATVEGLLPLAQRQAVLIRQVLGERRDALNAASPQLEKVTTPSLAALQAYSAASATLAGDRQIAPGDLTALAASAERDLRRALKHDPSFASAHILLAWSIYDQQLGQGHRSDAAGYLAEANAALHLSDTATDAERNFIVASVHDLRSESAAGWPYTPPADEPVFVREEQAQAIDAYEQYLRLRPGDARALIQLTQLCGRLGRNMELAQVLARVASARPNSFDANVTAAAAFITSGDLAASARFLDRAEAVDARRQDRPGVRLVQISALRAKLAWLRHDAAAAARELDRAADVGTDEFETVPTLNWRVAAAQLVFANVTLGRNHEAEAIAAAIPDPSARTATLATVLLAADRMAELRRLLRESASQHNPLGRGGGYLAEAGMVTEAKALADELQRTPTVVPSYVKLLQHAAAFAERRFDEATRWGEESLRLQSTHFNNQTLTIGRNLADAYVADGHTDRALTLLERETSQPAESIGRDWIAGFPWTLARNKLALVYRGAGREQDARAVEDELMRLLAAADADDPLLLDLKERIVARDR